MFQKRTVYDIFKLRIFLYFVVPIVLAAIIIFVNHRLNTKQYSETYNDFYVNYTDEVFMNMDEEINSIVMMDYWLKNDDIKRAFNSDVNISDSDAMVCMQHMRKMKNDFEIIDSILLINRKADCVIATNGKASLERFFDDVYRYKEYDATDFMDMRYPADTMLKFPPTQVEGNDEVTRYVLPVVKMASVSESPNSFFVFNISLEKLMGSRTTSKYTENTSFWFVNKKDRQFYCAGGKSISIDSEIWDIIEFNDHIQYYRDSNGEKYCVFTKTVSPSLMDYAYLVFVPVRDVDKAVSEVTLKSVIISLLIYLIFVFVVRFLATDIRKTFSGIIESLNFTEKVEMKEIFNVTDKISKEFSKILDENSNMKLEIKNMIGDVKEKMITDVINNKNRQVKMSLYKYEYFIPVFFRIIPQKEMTENILFSITEQLYSALHRYFDGMYETYEVKNLDREVHFILNVPRTLKEASLRAEIKKLADIISKNELNVSFEYYIGSICDSVGKLKDEYLKLQNSINGEKNISEKNKSGRAYIYRVSENNAIVNSILEGDFDKTLANIDRILVTNIVNDVSADDMKVLYRNIINTMITAIKMKKLDVDNLIEKIGGDVYFDMENKSETEISTFIFDMITCLQNSESDTDEDGGIAEIIRYIESNYSNNELSLEFVAKYFNVDSKSLSKQIKKHSNITFHKYLTEIRVEEAKRLLITTDMSVEEIYKQVGYISRTTFMRAFGSVENITPSEYRKKAKEQKG